ncbi:GDSL-like Lipase/Acylhydrolase family protein [Modestobacter sp. DSM 44400]|uniref:SGNH/GDSL hydrolase family protein n=1 Tax=Modestobacter sp. DSM 44400 TaxID=1550230 RepID=UPI00089C16D6|nr:SGNH/GDSL hydrolase family protein [Modestobacter sp. DSM 44400]SDY16112.1 GDSL-like Lipase/Acylhydrolase family protein [Modestobacter sp. DSM 44400]
MRRTVTALATAVLAATMGVVTALPAVAKDSPPTASGHFIETSPYVALGDSYSSAAGVAPFVLGSPPACSRSQLNYAHDIAAVTQPLSFMDVTCSGAKTSDFFTSQPNTGAPPQLDTVTKDTRLVTMTIGGNDGGAFTGILTGCITASLTTHDVAGNPCEKQYGSKFTDIVADQTYPNLVRALTAVHQKAPRATVVILGYPRVLPDTGVLACYPSMPISMGDVPYVDEWALALNGAVEKAAAETGSRFVDMSVSSAGHDACQPVGQRWVEPFSGPVNAYPVHPNATGEAAMAEQTLAQLGL